jgi:hypothetical protein
MLSLGAQLNRWHCLTTALSLGRSALGEVREVIGLIVSYQYEIVLLRAVSADIEYQVTKFQIGHIDLRIRLADMYAAFGVVCGSGVVAANELIRETLWKWLQAQQLKDSLERAMTSDRMSEEQTFVVVISATTDDIDSLRETLCRLVGKLGAVGFRLRQGSARDW